MIKLRMKLKNTVLKEFLTDKNEIAIGRDTANDICIDNLAISSRHARLFKGPDDKYAIEDLNSTNGTFVNDNQVMTHVLNDNDKVTIGKHTIHVAYQGDDAFKEQEPRRVIQNTYMIDLNEIKEQKQ